MVGRELGASLVLVGRLMPEDGRGGASVNSEAYLNLLMGDILEIKPMVEYFELVKISTGLSQKPKQEIIFLNQRFAKIQ